ncbi:hypothetical protein PYW07_010552 [Mythimna separata]|uniref:Peptidase S1 domain-containing protein n=1 Tax=Mythimna separata TaxID=271217 RepID=A0AAD7YA19_MYTSE|nr:hypothetical protein PYW07_010552 [Mythimna separata]
MVVLNVVELRSNQPGLNEPKAKKNKNSEALDVVPPICSSESESAVSADLSLEMSTSSVRKTKKRRARFTDKTRKMQIHRNQKKYVQNNPVPHRNATANYQRKNPEVHRKSVVVYQEKHPEVHRESVATYQEKHPEVHRESVAAYQKKHPEVHKKYVATYQENHPEVHRKSSGTYQEKHPEVHRKSVAAYQEKHPEVHRAAQTRYNTNVTTRPWNTKCQSAMSYQPEIDYECDKLIAIVSVPTIKSLEDLKIVGGEDIDITEAPYQVSLVRGGRHSCGGAIVAKDIVVTAAHCISGSYPEMYKVRVGSSYSQKGGDLYPVGDLLWHPDFNYSKMDSDIAILWLSRPLTFSTTVAPVEMMARNEEINDGDLTVVTGWGNLFETGGTPSKLQSVAVPKVNERVCSAAYQPVYSITRNMLCAGASEGGKDACQGDSGGPLVHNNKLAGIVSWGLGCARPDYPGVYAKISALRTWIDKSIYQLRWKHIVFRTEEAV